ncbi:MAG TPA: hypothetical protein VK358_06405, partial [Longimicrobium sp.]|nr:hypothetical protein [Longimicrobium sp.]
MALPVRGAVERRLPARPVRALPQLVAPLGDHGAHVVGSEPLPDARIAVALVARERAGALPAAPARARRDVHGWMCTASSTGSSYRLSC